MRSPAVLVVTVLVVTVVVVGVLCTGPHAAVPVAGTLLALCTLLAAVGSGINRNGGADRGSGVGDEPGPLRG